MEKLKIDPTTYTPKIDFDTDQNEFIISGKSMPEDSASFYEPIMNWLEEYVSSVNQDDKTLLLMVKLDYYNSSSMRYITDIFMTLAKMHSDGVKKLHVEWYYDVGDDLLKEAGEELSEILNVPFTIKVSET